MQFNTIFIDSHCFFKKIDNYSNDFDVKFLFILLILIWPCLFSDYQILGLISINQTFCFQIILKKNNLKEDKIRLIMLIDIP